MTNEHVPGTVRVVVTVHIGMNTWEFRSEWMDPIWAQLILDYLANDRRLVVEKSKIEREGQTK